jgi:hypothetical protein
MGENRVGHLKLFTTTAAFAFVATFSVTSFAQQDDLKQLAANRDKKMSSPFLRCATWHCNYDEARAAAKASNKLILGYFTRSYAPCGPCMQLEQTVLSKPEFVEFSKDVVLFCHVSTRIPTEPFNFLFAEKGGTAFPTLMVLDQDGNVLARQCGERSMRVVRDVVAEGRCFADLIQRSEAPGCDSDVQFDCLTKQIQYGHLTPDVARAKAAKIAKLSADRKAFLESSIVSRECSLALLDIRKAADEAGQYQAAQKLVAMMQAGHVPSDQNVYPFWEWILSYAWHVQDVKLYEDGVVAMRALYSNTADSRERLQEKEDLLNRMKRDLRTSAAGVVPSSGVAPAR